MIALKFKPNSRVHGLSTKPHCHPGRYINCHLEIHYEGDREHVHLSFILQLKKKLQLYKELLTFVSEQHIYWATRKSLAFWAYGKITFWSLATGIHRVFFQQLNCSRPLFQESYTHTHTHTHTLLHTHISPFTFPSLEVLFLNRSLLKFWKCKSVLRNPWAKGGFSLIKCYSSHC